MIRLKDFLIENDKNYKKKLPDEWVNSIRYPHRKELDKSINKAKKFVEEYNNGNWYEPKDIKHFLYRGSKRSEKWWDKGKIRKNRKPRDTPKWIDQFIENARKYFYPNVPSRRESKFAASSKSGRGEVGTYGDIFVVFPEKDVPIVSHGNDQFTVVVEVDRSRATIKKIFKNEMSSSEVEDFNNFLKRENERIYDFLEALVYNDGGFDFHFKFYKNLFSFNQKILQAGKKFQKKYSSSGDNVIQQLSYIVFEVKKYLDEVQENKGVKPNSNEVMFSGDEYLKINWSFWKRFFQYNFDKKRVELVPLLKKLLSGDFKAKRSEKEWDKFVKKFALLIDVDINKGGVNIKNTVEYNNMKITGGYVFFDGSMKLSISFNGNEKVEVKKVNSKLIEIKTINYNQFGNKEGIYTNIVSFETPRDIFDKVKYFRNERLK